MNIDESDFKDWMENSVTKYVFDDFRSRCKEYERQLIMDRSFALPRPSPEYNHFKTFACECYLKGLLTAYHELLSIKFNDIKENDELEEVPNEISAS